MSVKDTAKRQYVRIINHAANQFEELSTPSEGWITCFRKALGMSGPQLARKAGVTKAAIYQAERNERKGAITLKQLEKLAQDLGGKLVYAIVPEDQIEDIVHAQAMKKAEARIKRTSAHMALEKQSLPNDQIRQDIEQLAQEMKRNPSSDFWEDR